MLKFRLKSTQLKTDFCLRTKVCFFSVGSVNLPLNDQLIKEKAQIKTIFIFSSQLILKGREETEERKWWEWTKTKKGRGRR